MKKYFIAVLTLALSFNLAACGSSASTGDSGQKAGGQESASASGETITINIGHGGAESTAQQVGCLALKDYMEKNSNGAFTVNIYPNNSMGNDDELLEFPQFCPQKHHYCLYLYTTLKKCPKYKESYPFLM